MARESMEGWRNRGLYALSFFSLIFQYVYRIPLGYMASHVESLLTLNHEAAFI